ncbi:AAA family ATPase [Mameliella alba]|uniref:AAA family ATPase n=1 Tax=Mameliella alba TaxID=561184 RepID=UPI001C94508D|nr:AAA family ATPase [Mameliella alba]MBY6120758.1 AAA family ATPase [Mameliella alba]
MPDTVKDFLIRGADLLGRRRNFRLVGRGSELRQICGMLMRKHASNVLMVGPGGVGASSICLGLEAAKADASLPFDILSKRFFWLDTDGLFSSGSHARITEGFDKLRRTLLRTAQSVLVMDDFRDFIDAARNNGCTHLINAIMRDVMQGRYQSILEARDEDLEIVLKCHSNMREVFTLMEVREPAGDALREIIRVGSERLTAHHRVPVSEDAITAALDLTAKYHVSDLSLSRAQPERTLNLIDRALTAYRQSAHDTPPHLARLQATLSELDTALAKGATPQLQAQRAALVATQAEARADWTAKIDKLSALRRAQKSGEELLLALEEQLSEERARAEKSPEPVAAEPPAFSARLTGAGFGSREEARIQGEIREASQAIEGNKSAFEALEAEMNAGLELSAQAVTLEFSAISGIPADKLNQDEREKLLSLDATLKARVFGQDHAVDTLVGAVLMANAGLKEPDKPQGSFMFCGPSGVGKTEIAKAMAMALKDSEKAMLRFDMSEYMEKHALAKLIGAPPGYEGYEAGGILTNSVRRNPHAIILFDEIEKAHPDVFNVFLQVLDDGRLTDNRGLTVSFANTLILMTTNIGQPYFLDQTLTYESAMSETVLELEKTFRPEFLNRFNGRQNIIGFKALPLALIEKIAAREISKVNTRIQSSGHTVSIKMAPEQISALCADQYNPVHGARGIPGFFASQVYPQVARKILSSPDTEGTLVIGYSAEDGGRVELTYG